MIDVEDLPEKNLDDIISLVREGKTHSKYGLTVERARIMKSWYKAREYAIDADNEFQGKTEIVKKSPIESQDDYQYKLNNFDLMPFEYKFIQTQQRIYDENNVQRKYPDDFWKTKEAHFDDDGDEVDVFFRDKVLFTKEVEGFGAVCLDIATKDGQAIGVDGKPSPYPYVVQASELKYYETWHGYITLAITCVYNGGEYEWRAFTPRNIYTFSNQEAEPTQVEHNFGKTPVYLLKGALDPQNGFKIGMPRRWMLTGLYLAASELFYDLKLGSKLFGHPIPAMPFDMLKTVAGAWNEEKETINTEAIREEVGYVLGYDGENPPNKLFYQADMQGLQHLESVIFDKLINLIYQLANVRDKSKVVHNASGRSKQFDSVEEQGLLAQTATDMEAIEKEIFSMMATARGEDPDDFTITYSKHHDLSSADETWMQFVEGLQYGGVPKSVKEYQSKEYLRKKSAPTGIQDQLADELSTQGFPLSRDEIDALKDRVDDAILVAKARPELANTDALNRLQEELDADIITNETEQDV